MKNLVFLFITIILFSCQPGAKKEVKTETAGEPQLTEVTIQVGGMHCDMCVASIEKGVNELEGIESVKATLADSVAVVRFDSKKVDLAAIEKAIEKRGYTIKGKP